MNYWPLSTIAQSPLAQHPGFAWELSRVYATCFLSPAAFQACGDVARHTVPRDMPNLVIIQSVDAPARFAFTGSPDWDEWSRLERGGVIEASNGMLHIIIDALH